MRRVRRFAYCSLIRCEYMLDYVCIDVVASIGFERHRDRRNIRWCRRAPTPGHPAHLPDACVIDFSRAEDVQLHALGTLLIGFDQAKPLSEVTVRGWNKYHLAVINSFGYSLDTRGRLYKRAGDEMRRSADLTNNQSREDI